MAAGGQRHRAHAGRLAGAREPLRPRRPREYGRRENDRTYERLPLAQEWSIDIDETSLFSGSLSYQSATTDSSVGRTFTLDEDELVLLAVGRSAPGAGSAGFGTNLGVGADAWSTGLDLEQEGFDSPTDPSLSIDPNIDERVLQGGVFAVGELEYASWLALEFGIRAHFHPNTEPSWLPQGALMLTPWRGSGGRAAKLRFSAGRNVRIPTLREFYQPPVAQLGGAYFLEGNPDLEPEHATSYRLGLEVNPISWLSTSITGFYNDIEDHIRSEFDRTITTGFTVIPPDTSPGSDCDLFGSIFPELCQPIVLPIPASVFKRQNLDDVVTKGFEIRVQLRPHRSFDLQLGYTFLVTDVRDSNSSATELPNEPRHVVDLRAILTAPRIDTQLTVRTQFRSSAIVENSGTGLLGFSTDMRSDPSTTLDLRVAQPIGDHIDIYADLFNVTDNRFVDSYVVRGGRSSSAHA